MKASSSRCINVSPNQRFQRRHETQGVYHGPEVEPQGQKWYGSDPEPLERWLGYVLPDPAKWPATPSAPASVTSAAPAATEGR